MKMFGHPPPRSNQARLYAKLHKSFVIQSRFAFRQHGVIFGPIPLVIPF